MFTIGLTCALLSSCQSAIAIGFGPKMETISESEHPITLEGHAPNTPPLAAACLCVQLVLSPPNLKYPSSYTTATPIVRAAVLYEQVMRITTLAVVLTVIAVTVLRTHGQSKGRKLILYKARGIL